MPKDRDTEISVNPWAVDNFDDDKRDQKKIDQIVRAHEIFRAQYLYEYSKDPKTLTEQIEHLTLITAKRLHSIGVQLDRRLIQRLKGFD